MMLAAIAIGTIIRLVLASISDGTNDFRIWVVIATETSEKGIFEAYRTMWELNHPPLMVIWSMIALKGGTWFSLLIKLPSIIGDALSIWLLGRIWLERGDRSRARGAMLAMALSPIAILISGYHCNTDNLFAFLSLLAMYWLGMRQRFFLGGLALGAAINVKLIPILLIPVAFAMCRNWRQVMCVLVGLAIWVLPFVPLVIWAWDGVRAHMLTYVPVVGRWGVPYILFNIHTHWRFEEAANAIMRQYVWLGRWAILVAAGAFSLIAWSSRRWNAFELATLTYCAFLILAPGFGYQYLVVVVPLLLTVSITRSWVYGLLGGAVLLLMYWAYLESYQLPLITTFPDAGPTPGAALGLLAWGVLVMAATEIAGKDNRPDAEAQRANAEKSFPA